MCGDLDVVGIGPLANKAGSETNRRGVCPPGKNTDREGCQLSWPPQPSIFSPYPMHPEFLILTRPCRRASGRSDSQQARGRPACSDSVRRQRHRAEACAAVGTYGSIHDSMHAMQSRTDARPGFCWCNYFSVRIQPKGGRDVLFPM